MSSKNPKINSVDKPSIPRTSKKKLSKNITPKKFTCIFRDDKEIIIPLKVSKNSKNPSERKLYNALNMLTEDGEILYFSKLALYNFYDEFMKINGLIPNREHTKKIVRSKKETISKPSNEHIEEEEVVIVDPDNFFDLGNTNGDSSS